MAVDAFLKLDGIKGESKAEGHKDEIDIMSWSWGETQARTLASAGGGGAGKVQMQDFHFTMKMSTASPQLFLGCATGEHIKSGILTVRKAGAEIKGEQDFLKITLSDCLISSYQTGGSSESDLPVDQMSLNFAKIEFVYTPQTLDGAPGTPVGGGFDLAGNQKV